MPSYDLRKVPPHLHILLVDDSVRALAARKALLTEQGHSVNAVESPAAALEALATEEFDLIVADYKMPKVNGAELIRQVREIKPGISSVLLITYMESLSLTEKNTGVDYILLKCANEVDHLTRAVSRIGRLRGTRKPVRSVRPARKDRARGS